MTSKFLQIKEDIKKQINKFDKYINDYNNIAKTSQIPVTAYMNWGIELARKGELEKALNKFQTASLMANQNPDVYINIGIALLKQKKYEDAIINFRKAVRTDKFNARAYTMWATALSEIGDLKSAIKI